MTRATVHRGVFVLAATLLVGAFLGVGAHAQEPPSGPSITVSPGRARPGESVVVSISGFEAPSVVMTVCGNNALRRSMDCNQTESEGRRLNDPSGVTVADLPISVPPTTCPCVIVASTTNFAEVATTPFEIVGHPVGPLVGMPSLDPLQVSIEATRAGDGFVDGVRAALGGPTAYDVTVTVANRSGEVLSNVVLAGAAGRSPNDDVTDLDIPEVGPLEPGQTWERTVRAVLPAPVLGHFVWHVTASGAGPTATAEQQMRQLPVALVAVVALLLLDVAAVVARRVARRRARAQVSRRADQFGRSSQIVHERATSAP